jgi:hypothetical protein
MFVLYAILLKNSIPFNVVLWKSFEVAITGYIGKAHSK